MIINEQKNIKISSNLALVVFCFFLHRFLSDLPITPICALLLHPLLIKGQIQTVQFCIILPPPIADIRILVLHRFPFERFHGEGCWHHFLLKLKHKRILSVLESHWFCYYMILLQFVDIVVGLFFLFAVVVNIFDG